MAVSQLSLACELSVGSSRSSWIGSAESEEPLDIRAEEKSGEESHDGGYRLGARAP